LGSVRKRFGSNNDHYHDGKDGVAHAREIPSLVCAGKTNRAVARLLRRCGRFWGTIAGSCKGGSAMSISRIVFLVLAGGCLAPTAGNAVTAPNLPEPAEGPFDKDLLKAADEYKKWGRVDDEMRWSPELCRLPNPGRAYLSASADEATHGRKLYSLL